MKTSLLLYVASVFTVFHLCKASPLRHLEKRAAFYIANETACVVDNIVYSSGDPIPTDDPCEACKCRPPGFACVLKECRLKPGCRAVRHVGQCCPEYICGCEHNGMFYKDGDEIKDPKNPCYQCYCQGSSIACAFVDCIYRDECDSVFVPGECCPQYFNCTRDIPDINLFLGENPLPPANLLPAFNDESFLPEAPSIDQAVEFPENPINPIYPQDPNYNVEKAFSSESIESGDVSSESETPEPEIFETEFKSSTTAVEEKETEPLESSEEVKQDTDIPKVNENKEAIESAEEIAVSLNSESNIYKDDVAENLEAQDLKSSAEPEVELPQTTTESKFEVASEAELTEKPSGLESTNTEITEKDTEITEKDTEIKNSASENGKSLKLSDNDHLEEIKKEKHDIKPDSKIDEKKVAELVTESTSTVSTDAVKEISTIESKSGSEENVSEESQTNAQAAPVNINNAKVKSESAETVTIIVHVKESSKIPTETDFVAETVSPVSITSVSEEALLKSNEEIESINSNKGTSEVEDNKSTNSNFEIFPTTKQINEIELSSKSPSTDQISEDIQGRSDEADNIALEAEENPVSEEKVSDFINRDDSSVMTTTMDVIEVHNEARSDEKEITEETKIDEPTTTIIEIDASKPITVEIITDSASSLKPEKSTTELKSEKTEELAEETKDEKTKEFTEDSKNEETVKEAVQEVREVLAISEENSKVTTPEKSGEEAKKEKDESTQAVKLESTTGKEVPVLEEKIQESTTSNSGEKPEIRTNDEIAPEKNEEKTNTESTEEKTTKEIKFETTTESQNQVTEESKQTTLE